MTNLRNTVLYTGVTNDLIRRVYEHKQKLVAGFTKKYNIVKLGRRKRHFEGETDKGWLKEEEDPLNQ